MTAGTPVSHYEIVEKLGEGGMGVVYKAIDLSLHRFVALKFLPSEITSHPDRVARFESEARAISALNHPNIATIHAMDEDAGRRFLVLEYLEGGTLRERMRKCLLEERPFPLHVAASMGIQLASGLAHAHRKGVIHRDIKPENVMFTAEGVLRITDFGLAKPLGSSEITRDGTTVGTASYMGPEQALHNESTPRGDLFSAGVVLYEMVAGRRPFLGATEMGTLQAMLHEQPPPIRLLRPETPPEFERILLRLLEKNPAKRYQTGDELASDLRELRLTDDPSAERHYSGATRSLTRALTRVAPLQERNKRRAWIAAAALTFLILGLAAVGLFRSRRAHTQIDTQVAVLPFTAASGAAEDVAFGSGLAGIVGGKLASLGANVVPDNDLRRNRVSSPADARRVFGIPTVLVGKFDREPSGSPRITLQVVDTRSGKTLRSAVVTSSGGLQDEVLRRAAELLHISPDPGVLSKLRSQDSRTATAYDYYVLGNGYLQRYDQPGSLGFAIAAFRKAIQIEPSYAIAYAALGTAYWQEYRQFSRDQQDLEHAHDAAMQAISRNESLASPHITLGAIAVSAGQVEEGISQLKRALDLDPVNAEGYRELANAWVAAGKLDEAERTYKRAIQYRPAFWLGYENLAVFYNGHGRYREAEQALTQAAALTPDNFIVYRNLGGVQMLLGEWQEAEHSFRRAAELRPQGSVYSNLGTLYIYMGRYQDAVQVLEQAVALSGGEISHMVWGNLGDAYRWSESRKADAPVAYEKAIRIASSHLASVPGDPTLLSQIAVYRAKLGNFAEAEKDLSSAEKVAPKDGSVLFRCAVVRELEKKRSTALSDLQAALDNGYSLSIVEREPELFSLRKDPAWPATAAHAKEKN